MQSKFFSLIEALTNTAVGFVVALLSQLMVFPCFGIHLGTLQNLQIVGIFTAISVARSYLIRRFFTRKTERVDEAAELRKKLAEAHGLLHTATAALAQKQADSGKPRTYSDLASEVLSLLSPLKKRVYRGNCPHCKKQVQLKVGGGA
jgi:hypothetical protein